MNNRYIFSILIFFNSFFGWAQSENFSWKVNFGINIVDTYPTGDSTPSLGTSGAIFEDVFNATDHWNLGGPSIGISRYITSGFSAGVQGNLNKIIKIEGLSNISYPYYSVDGFLSFHPLRKGFLRPFIKGGYGYSSFKSSPDIDIPRLSRDLSGTLFGGIGFDIMIGESFGLSLESSFRNTMDSFSTKHLQHLASLNYQFGSKDSDKDGVPDKKDDCPEVPGLKEFNGCPDTDGDTIIDKEDRCPEIAGTLELNGCIDTDSDGIADPDDECPELAGSVELKGCPDSDGDGVSDTIDECVDQSGPEENKGCPWPDTDGDGIPDKDDLCKDEAGIEANNGCPDLSDEILKTLNEFGTRINFAASSNKIYGKKTIEVLNNIKTVLMENPDGILIIEGYASADGDEDYNIELSVKRAESIRDYLVNIGVPIERLEVQGLGEASPLGDNNSPEGRAINRRVQFKPKRE
ncbi:MAG: OmpA family protein [Flavobacteriaceae bacterium]